MSKKRFAELPSFGCVDRTSAFRVPVGGAALHASCQSEAKRGEGAFARPAAAARARMHAGYAINLEARMPAAVNRCRIVSTIGSGLLTMRATTGVDDTTRRVA